MAGILVSVLFLSLSHWFGACTVVRGLFSLFLDLEHEWSCARFDNILLRSPRCLDIGQGKPGSQRTLDVMARCHSTIAFMVTQAMIWL